ncbi:hydrolase [Enterococcus florum]|uniref:Hydrolase n=1 Tax=Enterococcus florum TaxID=2480627 RepID=A0A4P5PFN7_9ENTE|nr:endonuclease/exonuclease/phosphatase family protein [Enterococcus florum]GCF95068.1 hydrolase [Enterococcus florum]
MEEDVCFQVKELAKRILDNDYALIALQEVNQRMDSRPAEVDAFFQPTLSQAPIHDDNFLYLLIEELKRAKQEYYWSWSYNHIGYDKYHEGVGLLSKEPIRAKEVLVSNVNDPVDHHTRKILIGETSCSGRPVTAVSAHLSWWETATSGFSYEWQMLETALSQSRSPLLVMGDFNNSDEAIGEGYSMILSSPLRLFDSYEEAESKFGRFTVQHEIDGWSENHTGLRIDYIFYQRPFQATAHSVVFDEKNSSVISDHFGVEAQFD